MRKEFVDLNDYFRRMHSGTDITREFLKKVECELKHCMELNPAEMERAVAVRTEYWLRKRAAEAHVEIDMPKYSIAIGTKKKESPDIKANDSRFLRSLRIKPMDED